MVRIKKILLRRRKLANTSRSKKTSILSHPIDTIIHWYDEVQILPTTFKRNAKLEVERTMHTIRHLKHELKKATRMSRRKLARKPARTMKLISNRLSSAQNQLKIAKIKQTYYKALEKALKSFNRLFKKKHVSTVKAKRRKNKVRSMATHPTHRMTHARLSARRAYRKPHARHLRKAAKSSRAAGRRTMRSSHRR